MTSGNPPRRVPYSCRTKDPGTETPEDADFLPSHLRLCPDLDDPRTVPPTTRVAHPNGRSTVVLITVTLPSQAVSTRKGGLQSFPLLAPSLGRETTVLHNEAPPEFPSYTVPLLVLKSPTLPVTPLTPVVPFRDMGGVRRPGGGPGTRTDPIRRRVGVGEGLHQGRDLTAYVTSDPEGSIGVSFVSLMTGVQGPTLISDRHRLILLIKSP